MGQEEVRQQYSEGSPWFWKMFGGTIVGFVGLLLIGHIANINAHIDRTFLDVRSEVKDFRMELDSDLKEFRFITDAHKDRITALEQLPHREKIEGLEKQFKERIEGLEKQLAAMQLSLDEQKQKAASNETAIAALREELKTLREWNKEATQKLQEVREKMAAEAAKQEQAKLAPQP